MRSCPFWSTATGLLVSVVMAVTLVGCESNGELPPYEARVGDRYLTKQELSDALAALPVRQDSVEARQQIIEQWVSNELLYQEAQHRGLRQDPEVQRLLKENERSVLVSALISRVYEESISAPTPAEMQAYFERHKEQLRLREPFVRVRHLAARTPASAQEARRQLQEAVASDAADSVWQRIIGRYAVDESDALGFSDTYYPERRLFALQPDLASALGQLRSGQIAPVIDSDDLYHVIQLVERVPAGATPEPAWIEDELTRRLVIQSRKQMYARQVQRLRNEALSRDNLEVR